MSLLTVHYEDGTVVELDIKTKHLLAAESRFPGFDHRKQITSSFQVAYCAARAAGETRSWDDWLDAVDRVDPGEALALAVDETKETPSPESLPSPPSTRLRRAN